jgi:hypothetical protein
LEIVAVNANDSAADITHYVNDNKLTFQIVMGGSGEQYTLGNAYGVRGYPTNYLMDAATGKIVWRGTIFNEEALRDTLADMGLK